MGWFTSYGSSQTIATETPQTDCYFGPAGLDGHGHVVDHNGIFVFGRDVDGSPITADQVSIPRS
jgi:hypothetical protein